MWHMNGERGWRNDLITPSCAPLMKYFCKSSEGNFSTDSNINISASENAFTVTKILLYKESEIMGPLSVPSQRENLRTAPDYRAVQLK